MSDPTLFSLGVVLMAAVVATATDLRSFRIYNVLTFPLLVSGLLYHFVVHGSVGLANGLLGMLFCLAILSVFFLMGGMGGGDVKLMAGVGAWLGMPLTWYVFLATVTAAGLYALVLIVLHGRLRETWVSWKVIWYRFAAVGQYLGGEEQVENTLRRPDRRQRVVPFAAMVTIGILAVLTWSWFKM